MNSGEDLVRMILPLLAAYYASDHFRSNLLFQTEQIITVDHSKTSQAMNVAPAIVKSSIDHASELENAKQERVGGRARRWRRISRE